MLILFINLTKNNYLSCQMENKILLQFEYVTIIQSLDFRVTKITYMNGC